MSNTFEPAGFRPEGLSVRGVSTDVCDDYGSWRMSVHRADATGMFRVEPDLPAAWPVPWRRR